MKRRARDEGRGTRKDRRRTGLLSVSLIPHPSPLTPAAQRAFTLIELLVVMSIIALLLAIAVPRYLSSTDKAKEAVLMENLSQMRAAIDQFHADRGKFPERLEDLVEKKYLRNIPKDPITQDASTWVVIPPTEKEGGAVYDVRSGAPGTARDGRPYKDW